MSIIPNVNHTKCQSCQMSIIPNVNHAKCQSCQMSIMSIKGSTSRGQDFFRAFRGEISPLRFFFFLLEVFLSPQNNPPPPQTTFRKITEQCTFHLERSSFFYLLAIMIRTQHSVYFAYSCTKHKPDSYPGSGSEAMPHESHLYQNQGV